MLLYQASQSVLISLSFVGLVVARSVCSSASLLRSYNSHSLALCFITIFQLPFIYALPFTCSKKISFRPLFVLACITGSRLFPSSGVNVLPLYAAGYLDLLTSSKVGRISVTCPIAGLILPFFVFNPAGQ